MSLTPLAALPSDLAGRTLLEVGCGNGSLARAAAERGAQVVAIDIDADFIRQAREVSADLVADRVDYRVGDLEVALPEQQFDHVVCSNLLHRVRHPLAVLDRLGDVARRSLVMDVTGPDAERPWRLLRRDYGAIDALGTTLPLLPVAVIGRHGTPTRKREQNFFFSESALRNILLEQRRCYVSFTTIASDHPGRYVASAVKRRVEQLVLVTGLTGSGKSRFLDMAVAGDQTVGAIIGHDVGSWTVANSSAAQQLDPEVDSLLYHYDLLRAWRRDAGVHERDEGLDVLAATQKSEVIVLITQRLEMRSRLLRELSSISDRGSRQACRLREVIDLYENADRTADRVQAFLDYCSRRCVSVRFVSATDHYRPLDPSRWRTALEAEPR